jgi:uracil-DNA glycosylase family 4
MPAVEDIKPATVAIVAEQPYQQDDTYGQIFVSKQMADIRKFFKDKGIDVYCTYALKCPRPHKDVKPTEKNIKVCAHGIDLKTKKQARTGYLQGELELVKPKHIITLGANAFYGATGKKQGSIRPNGGRYLDEKTGIYLYPTVHPLQATYSAQAKAIMWADLERFADWIKNGAKERVEFNPPVYVADTLKSLRNVQKRIRAAGGLVAVDTETQGLNPYVFGKQVRSIQFCWDEDFGGVFVPLGLEKDCYYTNKEDIAAPFWTDEPLSEAVEIIREILWESRCIWHNGKFDRLWLYMWGLREFGEPILAPNTYMDTLHVAHNLDENRVLKLKQLITSELGYPTYDIADKLTKDLDVLIPYAAKDTVCDLMIAKKYASILETEEYQDTRRLYTWLLRPMDKLFTKMELRGWPVDRDTVLEVQRLVTEAFIKTDRKLHELLLEKDVVLGYKKGYVTKTVRGKQVQKEENVPVEASDIKILKRDGLDACKELGITLDSRTFASPQKLAKLLFTTLGYQPSSDKSIAYTDSGGLATSEDALVHLKGDPFIDTLFDWRGHAKARSTYADPMLEAAEVRGRLSTSYKLHGTTTGRTASGKEKEKKASGKERGGMNLQNLPYDVYGPSKLSVRHCVKARKGWKIVEADFSQVELRVAGMLSKDPLFTQAYKDDKDIHAIRAMRVAGYTPEAWEELPKKKRKELRQKAKAVNFGFLYGMSARTFQKYALTDYGVVFTMAECKQIREQFFKDHTGLEKWYLRQERELLRKGYVENLTGRRRHLPDMQFENATTQEQRSKYRSAIRMAINTPVQSFASDMKLMSLLAVDKAIDEDYAYLFGEIHDSILLEVRDDMLDTVIDRVLKIMSHPPLLDKFGIELTIPVKAEVKVGQSLGEAVDYVPGMVAA